MSTSKFPNPGYIKKYMNEGMDLQQFDTYLHAGLSGKIFHGYSGEFIKKLNSYGIKTFTELKEAFDKVQAKTSNYPSAIRKIIQGHYTYYMNELKASEAIWATLTPDQYEKAKDHDYLVLKDEPKD